MSFDPVWYQTCCNSFYHISLFEDTEKLVIIVVFVVVIIIIINVIVLQCRDTYWIESLHFVMLIYAQKRIHVHFGRADSYKMRMQLAILDWVYKSSDEVVV